MLNFFLAVIGGRKTPSLHDPPIILGGEPRSVTHPFQCPICVMSMTCERTLKDHFVKCAPLNGNPFGFYCYQGTGFDTAKDVRSAKAMNEEA